MRISALVLLVSSRMEPQQRPDQECHRSTAQRNRGHCRDHLGEREPIACSNKEAISRSLADALGRRGSGASILQGVTFLALRPLGGGRARFERRLPFGKVEIWHCDGPAMADFEGFPLSRLPANCHRRRAVLNSGIFSRRFPPRAAWRSFSSSISTPPIGA